MSRYLRREAWVVGLFILFALLLIVTRVIQPNYGAGDVVSLARAVLPYAFAVAAQTIVVLAGGIDLSVASMMALTSVTAAAMMNGASEEYALFVVPFVLAMGFALGAVNGILIVVTRVPDIVVTLATLFVLQGAALLVLQAPGGDAADWLKALVVGSFTIPGRRKGSRPMSRRPSSCWSFVFAPSGSPSGARGSACRSTLLARANWRRFVRACPSRAPGSSPMRSPACSAPWGG